MEAGIDWFAAILPDLATGWPLFASDRAPNLFHEAGPADRGGLDRFGIGRHQRTEVLEARADAVQ